MLSLLVGSRPLTVVVDSLMVPEEYADVPDAAEILRPGVCALPLLGGRRTGRLMVEEGAMLFMLLVCEEKDGVAW